MRIVFVLALISVWFIGCADARTPDRAAPAEASAASADTILIADGRVYGETPDHSAWLTRDPMPAVFAAARAHWQAQSPEYLEETMVVAVADGAFTEPGTAQQAVLYAMSFEPRCCPSMGIAVIQDDQVVRNVVFANPAGELRAIPDLDGDGRNELVTTGSFGMGGQNTTSFTLLSFGDAGLVERSGPSILDESCGAMQEGGSAARVTAAPGPVFTIERFGMVSCESFEWRPAGSPETIEIPVVDSGTYVSLTTP